MDNWTYEYDANGMRTRRYCDWCGYQYIYSGSQLTQMKFEGSTLNFTYDASGTPLTMSIDGTVYYYVTNLQGDVVGLLDTTGAQVVTYTYDAWGVGLTVTGTKANSIGMLNPLRYRGYVYDVETQLYYLQSRYYDPEMGRFINADDVDYLGADGSPVSYNLFAYCKNNPLIFCDYNGYAPEWWQWAVSGVLVVAGIAMVATGVGGVAGGALISAGANSIIGSYVSEASGGSSFAGWAGGMITGAINGTGAGVAGSLFMQATNATGAACLGNLALSMTVAFGSGSLGSAAGQCTSAAIDGKKLNKNEIVQSSMLAGAVNCLSGIGAGMGNALQGMPTISTTTTTLANSLNAGWSIIVETVCDFLGTLPSIFH